MKKISLNIFNNQSLSEGGKALSNAMGNCIDLPDIPPHYKGKYEVFLKTNSHKPDMLIEYSPLTLIDLFLGKNSNSEILAQKTLILENIITSCRLKGQLRYQTYIHLFEEIFRIISSNPSSCPSSSLGYVPVDYLPEENSRLDKFIYSPDTFIEKKAIQLQQWSKSKKMNTVNTFITQTGFMLKFLQLCKSMRRQRVLNKFESKNQLFRKEFIYIYFADNLDFSKLSHQTQMNIASYVTYLSTTPLFKGLVLNDFYLTLKERYLLSQSIGKTSKRNKVAKL